MKMRDALFSLFGLIAASRSVAGAPYKAIDLYTLQPPAGLAFLADHRGAFAGQVVGDAAVPNAIDPTSHAVLWNPGGSAVDLNPDPIYESHVSGTDGIHQFGSVDIPDGGIGGRPVVWNGSAASATFLDQTGFIGAHVTGGRGGQFVGGAGHALLWNGLTGTVIDLHPTNLAGFDSSDAFGTSGTQQVGFGEIDYHTNDPHGHALLWTGSADSAVDLNPTNLPGYTDSGAVATDGHQQVGSGGPYGVTHALLWSGTADSAVDLNPPRFEESLATAVSNGIQVGYGNVTGGVGNALLWTGTADSVVYLHDLLPSGYTYSVADSIDDAGDVFGVAYDSSGGHAIEWIPQAVPEPASATAVGLGGLALLARRRKPSIRSFPLRR